MTVSELIHALGGFPGDLLVGIEDADTAWTLHVLTVASEHHKHGRVVLISGAYGEEIPRNPWQGRSEPEEAP